MKISNDKIERIAKFRREVTGAEEVKDIERIAGMFPRGYISIVASMAGTGKTWLMQYVVSALSVGGRMFNGLVHKSPVYKSVILSGETGTHLINNRMTKTSWPYDSNNISMYSSIEMMLNDIPVMLNTAEGRETIIAIMANEKPDIVYFDTLISFHTADESKQGDMTNIYTFLLRLAQAFNCAVVCNHHMRKRPVSVKGTTYTYTQDDVIGTSAGVRLASAVYLLTAEQQDFGNSEITVRNVKAWDRKIPAFKYSFINDDAGLIDFKISFDTDAKNYFWSIRERIRGFIRDFDNGAILKPEVVANELRIDKENCRNYLEEFVKRGELVRTKLAGVNVYRVQKN